MTPALEQASQHFQYCGEGVQRSTRPNENEDDGEGLCAGMKGMNGSNPDGRDVHDRLEQGIQETEAQNQITDGACQENQSEGSQADPHPA